MPEVNGTYLANFRRNNENRTQEVYFEGGKWFYDNPGGLEVAEKYGYKITHWIPMPQIDSKRLSDLVNDDCAEEIARQKMPINFKWKVKDKNDMTSVPKWIIDSIIDFANNHAEINAPSKDEREMVAQAWIDGNREGWEQNTDWPEDGYKYYDKKYT